MKFLNLFCFLLTNQKYYSYLSAGQLLSLLEKISQDSQIFIVTHSPYLLEKFDKSNHDIKVFSRKSGESRIKSDSDLNLFPFSPSWGDINYFAFEVVSEEFHNKLFDYLIIKYLV